jgi:hypothetical protein
MPLKIKGLTSGSVVIKAPDTGAEDVEYDIANDFATPTSVSAVDTRVNAVGGRKNLIINGGFDVWQRGTTGNAANAFVYASADRWEMVRSSINKATDSSGKTYANVVCGNWADNNYISQHIEGTNEMSGKTLTFSFTISSSTLSDGRVYIRHLNGSTWTTAVWSNIFTYSSTDTIKTYTFTLPSTKIDQIQVFIYGHAGTSNENGKSFNIKNAQLEVGSTATDFEHRSYGEELALCQRYYEKSADLAGTVASNFNNGASWRFRQEFKVQKRTTPTVSLTYSGNVHFRNGTTVALSSVSADHGSVYGFRCTFGATDSTYDAGYINNIQFIADAEL